MGLFSKTKQGPQTVVIKDDIQLECPICQHDTFYQKKYMLNTAILTFFDFDWANRSATCFECSNCTHIMWFNA